MLDQPIIDFRDTAPEQPIIKVFGVGGGGCNAVEYIYTQGIDAVTLTVCNTDAQTLRNSAVPTQLLLGTGLGAGMKVEVGQQLGEQHAEAIRAHLDDGTRMLFVATGLGGGTGTAVAPIVARIAREMDILTIGVVTLPFIYEERQRIETALKGVETMRQVTDALIVINNQRVLSLFPDLPFEESYTKINEVLYNAVRSITEIITRSLKQNADFNDVKTVLENSSFAVMNQVRTRGERRVYRALTDIVNSPLLDNRNIYEATRILIVVRSPKTPEYQLLTSELKEIEAFTKHFKDKAILTKMGWGIDTELHDEVCVTLLASGFDAEEQPPHTADHEDWEAEANETRAQREARYKLYYGTTKRQKPEPFIFRHVADLDSESLIEQLAKQPAYKRTIMSNIALKRRLASAEVHAAQQALAQAQTQPTTPPEILMLDIDTGATYELN